MIQTVVKRDGRIVGFNEQKIMAAIRKAMLHTDKGEDERLLYQITDHIAQRGESQMTVEQIRAEVQACTDRIVEITGEAPKFFRPPFIAVSQEMYDNIDLTFICGAGCEDWVPTVSTQERIDRVLANAEDGQIVLLHDMMWNQNTADALKVIIPELKKRGFRFVTCAQLFEEKGVTPKKGWLYSNALQTVSDNRL